jgi:hypothetical protein
MFFPLHFPTPYSNFHYMPKNPNAAKDCFCWK